MYYYVVDNHLEVAANLIHQREMRKAQLAAMGAEHGPTNSMKLEVSKVWNYYRLKIASLIVVAMLAGTFLAALCR